MALSNRYRVARLQLADGGKDILGRKQPPVRVEDIMDVVADRMTQEGGMLNFWTDHPGGESELVASFHAQWWIAASRLDTTDGFRNRTSP